MEFTGTKGEVKIITVDPGHFHAALVQKTMYEQVSPDVCVYAPDGQDVMDHLERIKGFNSRPENPTSWQSKVYPGVDYLEKVLADKPGNVVVLAGNNRKKAEYIKKCAEAGLNVLSDKPMCVNKEGYGLLLEAFELAQKNGVLVYDIMTERFEITTILQKELANMKEVFGDLQKGSVDEPAVVKESVHHLFKYVAGNPLKRPMWYFDTTQQGEGITDVTTHLVDMVMWECFPGEVIGEKEIDMKKARRWPTLITREQFEKVTGHDDFPDYLKTNLNSDGVLPCYCNGEMIYSIRGVHTKISVVWDYQAPEGAGDTHYSVIRGSLANVVIRQGREENYRPELYVEPAKGVDVNDLGKALEEAMKTLQAKYPGVDLEKKDGHWHIRISDQYHIGHESHFGEVTKCYLKYLVEGKLPDWEVPNMITKYYTTTKALEMAQK